MLRVHRYLILAELQKKRKPRPLILTERRQILETAMNVRLPQLPAGLQFGLLTLGQDLPAGPHTSLSK